MKRALLIAGGTVGGLGAVLSITPPQLGSSGISTLAGASADTSAQNSAQTGAQNSAPAANATPTTSPNKTASKAATSSNTSTKKSTASKSTNSTTSNSTSSNSNSNSTTNSDNTAVAAPAPAGVTGTFTGDVFNVSYGNVQVRITVSNGKITDAVALQAPSGRNQRYTDYAIPNLRQQTLSAQSAAISGVGGASYTSYGWYKSLISALQKAGLPTGV